MGDIADMMLEGILDEETGEYIGDQNEAVYGDAAPGFPISYERQYRERNEAKRHKPTSKLKVNCPVCNKRIKVAGLVDHCLNVHGEI